MAGIALSGLTSGLDTNSMVTQLMAIEKQGRNRLVYQQVNAQARADALSSVTTKLNTLKYAANDLKSNAFWTPTQTVASTDTAKVGVTRTGGAGAGATTVDVLSLASSSQRTFTYTPPVADDTVTFGAVSFNVKAGASLDDVVSTINGTSEAGVIAVNAGGKLVVSSTTTGASSAFTWSGGALAQDSAKAGADAQYKLDGGAIQTSATNTVKDAIPGVEMVFKGVTGSAVSVTVTAPTVDKQAISDKLKGFVTAYNDLIDTLKTLTGEKKVNSPTSSAEAAKGSLYGDSGLQSLYSRLRSAVSDAVSGLPASANDLADLGISTGKAQAAINADSVAGKLTFDETAFAAKFSNDPVGVRKLLGAVTGTSGIGQRFSDLITPYTQVNGILAGRKEMAGTELRTIQKSLDTFDARMSAKQTRLEAQFAAMESALNRQNSAGTALTNQLNSLNSSSS